MKKLFILTLITALLLGTATGVRAEATDTAAEPTPLVIYGAGPDDIHSQTVEAMGGLAVTFLDGRAFNTAQELAQALSSGALEADILVLEALYTDIPYLMAEGYAADLSGSQTLQDYADSLYPNAREAGLYEGRLLMVPAGMEAKSMLSYYADSFERVSADMALPGTYDELISLIQRWDEDLAGKYPDMLPFHAGDYKSYLLDLAIGMYAEALYAQGMAFTSIEPRLIQMLQSALSLDPNGSLPEIDLSGPDAEEEMQAIYAKLPLMGASLIIDPADITARMTPDFTVSAITPDDDGRSNEPGDEIPLPLVIDEGETPVTSLTLTLMSVNPNSNNIRAAIAYIEAYITNIPPEKRILMSPGMDAETLSANLAQYAALMDEHLAALAESIEKFTGTQKEALEGLYEETKQAYAVRAITPEAIESYRALLENSYVNTYDRDMAVNGNDMRQLAHRLYRGDLTVEEFAAEADEVLKKLQ